MQNIYNNVVFYYLFSVLIVNRNALNGYKNYNKKTKNIRTMIQVFLSLVSPPLLLSNLI